MHQAEEENTIQPRVLMILFAERGSREKIEVKQVKL